MLSPSLEDYLEEIYRFSLVQEGVRVTDVSQRLRVSLPSVTKALVRLRDQEYIVYRRYALIHLTDKGRKLGAYLVERNALLQDFLRLLRADCDIAAEAEAMEHYLSQSTILSIRHLLEFMQSHPEIYRQYVEDWTNRQSGGK